MTETIIALVVGAIFGGLGLVFLLVALRARKKAKAAALWPVAEGTVFSTGMQEHRSYNSQSHRTSYSYEPIVEYSYSVMGTPYTGRRIAFGANSFDRRTAEGVLARYPAQSQVQVRYDPNNPQEAVLEAKAAGGVVFIVIAVIFMLVGAGGCLAGAVFAFMSTAK